ncbi:MAG: hypothetical protein L3K03_04195 [Thermoplasmata archaeon]|nr:hypothetical protein [Thermoplasmata archaeon]
MYDPKFDPATFGWTAAIAPWLVMEEAPPPEEPDLPPSVWAAPVWVRLPLVARVLPEPREGA